MTKPAARREAVGMLRAVFGWSERRACRALGFSRSSHRYQSRRTQPGKLVERMRELAQARPRFGYRRLHLLLRREGVHVNHKRIYRLYRLEGLSVRAKRRKRLVSAPREALASPSRPNQRWSMDFVSDSTDAGQRFRVLTVVDDFSRRCVTLVTAISFSGRRVSLALDAAILDAPPETIVMDNGPEFTSKALDQWAHERNVKLHFIRPGKPVENAYAESFNGRFRDECLNANWFANVLDARERIDAWRDDYNEHRPHSSLDGLTPEEYEEAFNQRKLPSRVA